MQTLLILKLGSTTPRLAAAQGDFEHWIERRMRVGPGRVAVIDPRTMPLPQPQQYGGVILTGSHAMVTDHEEWSERTAQWLLTVMETKTPLLGICYGHQLIAYALGGEVGDNPRGREVGTVEIELHQAAASDPLFADLPARFLAHASHTQSVLQLPPHATWLASSHRDPHHAYRVDRTTWAVQFHPEFDLPAMQTYIDQSAELLRAQGDDPSQLHASAADTPHATALLQRFAELVS